MPWFVRTSLILFSIILIFYVYCGIKLYFAFRRRSGWTPRQLKVAIVATIAYLNVFPIGIVTAYAIGGVEAARSFTGTDCFLDIAFVVPAWTGLALVVHVCLLYLLTDLFKLAGLHWYRKHRERWKEWEARFLLWSFVGLTAYTLVRVYTDTWVPRVHEYTIPISSALRDLDGLSIALIADIQGDERTSPKRIGRFVQMVNDLHPDFVMFGGDAVTSGEDYIQSTVEAMRHLHGRIANVAALGDHDFFSDEQRVFDGLRQNNFIVADDSTAYFAIGRQTLAVTIVTNTYPKRPKPEWLWSELQNVNADYRIVLTHQPSEPLVNVVAQHGYDLLLAGHSHGGSIAFGIPGLYVWTPARAESRYFSGKYDLGKLTVVVTNGLGHTLTPIRFQAPTEVTFIRLVAR
jgi:predicted MPP superfamily phosphohydrolase